MPTNRKLAGFLGFSPLFAIFGAMLLTYGNAFENGFHFDDFHTIVDNPAIRSLRNIPRFFVDTSTFSVLPANQTYRPFVSTSLAVDYFLGHGYSPVWFHAGTFLLFLLLVGLLAAFYRLILDNAAKQPENCWVAFATAAWFGLHPAVAETVNYVIQRGDLFCTLGCVAALFLFGRFHRLRRSGVYLLPLIFALLSKPPAAVFPLLLLFYVYYFEAASEPHRLRISLIAAIPSSVVTGVLLYLESAMTPKSFAPSVHSPWDYRLIQPLVWLRYCAQLFLPIHLNVDSDLAPSSTLTAWEYIGFVFVVMLLAAIFVCTRRRVLYPVAFGLLWFILTQLPTSLYALSEVENDHRMFFSFAGLMLAVSWASWLVLQRLVPIALMPRARPYIAAATCLLLCGYAWGAHRRNAVWRDEPSLWLDDVQKSPHNGRGLMIYGLTLMNKGDFTGALDYFNRALVFTPNYPALEINLGVVNGAMAKPGDTIQKSQAEKHFLRAIALAPNEDNPHAYYGRWLEQQSRFAEAIDQLHTAVALNPLRLFQRDLLLDTLLRAGDLAGATKTAQETLVVAPDDASAKQFLDHPPAETADFWISLSLTQYRNGRYEDSIGSAQHALRLNPKSAEAYTNIGASYGAMGQWDEAIANERRALALNPDLQIAKNNLAWYSNQKNNSAAIPAATQTAVALINESLRLNQIGKYEESIAVARNALRMDPRSAEAWNNIAADDEALHRWDDAIAAAEQALALNPDLQIARNNLAWSLSQKKLATH
jgi:tetratricopeptide (TPR) repeat protein